MLPDYGKIDVATIWNGRRLEAMKPKYREGPEARKKFDEGMTKLFRVPKSAVVEVKPKPKPKHKKSSKG